MTQSKIKVINYKFDQSQIPDESILIETTSRSLEWSKGLSPFFVGPVKIYGDYVSANFENLWQYTKVYPIHVDEDQNPTEKYFQWAEKGWKDTWANRYPMGSGYNAPKPLYSWWDGKKLSYIEARNQIYIPLYAKAVSTTAAFVKLKEIYQSQKYETLYLLAFDSYNLTPGAFDYHELAQNPNIKFGHGYVLAMMLENKNGISHK